MSKVTASHTFRGRAVLRDISLDIQRFQVHYTLKEIEEMQDFLTDAFERSKHHGDLQDLYRRRYGRVSGCMSDIIADRTLF